MPVYLLTNMNTQLGIINKAQTLVSKVISDSQYNAQLFDLSNFAYYSSFFYTAGQQHFIEPTSSYMYFIIY